MAKKNNQEKPTFNSYWIYGLIISILIGMSMFGGNSKWQNLKKTDISNFEKFLMNGDVEEVVVINKNLARVTINQNAIVKSEHNSIKSKNFLGQENIEGPHYQFEVGNLELFQRKLEKAEENGIVFRYEFQTIENRWMDMIISFLPIIIIIAVWIFLMRRMSGGSGGAGSQIFNIGKSKARLFDQNTNVRTSFKDVAGLEGAKEEVQEIVDFLKNPQKYTKLGGKIPTNTSGGLKARGHAPGATGIAQVVEIVQQLRGEAGDRQVKNAKIGMVENHGGTAATAVVHILEGE